MRGDRDRDQIPRVWGDVWTYRLWGGRRDERMSLLI